MANATMLDIAKINGSDAVVGLIEENRKYTPELEVFPARTISGTSYKTLTSTGLPTAGFRNANEGVTPGKSTFKNETHQCYIFDGQVEVDKAVAMADEFGLAAFCSREASGVTKALMQQIGSQIFYGTDNESKGFSGLKAFTPKGGSYTVDAQGTTATTASSVYAVKFGVQDVSLIFGRDTVLDFPEFREQQLADSDGKKYTGLVSGITGWAGLQIGNQYSVGRIANLTEDTGKGLTDDLIADLLAKFPVGSTPDAIFLNRRSLKQFRKSISIVSVINSKPVYGRIPSEAEAIREAQDAYGIQLVLTDSILSTDAIES